MKKYNPRRNTIHPSFRIALKSFVPSNEASKSTKREKEKEPTLRRIAYISVAIKLGRKWPIRNRPLNKKSHVHVYKEKKKKDKIATKKGGEGKETARLHEKARF